MTITLNYVDPNKNLRHFNYWFHNKSYNPGLRLSTLKIKKFNLRTHKGRFLFGYAKKFLLPFKRYNIYTTPTWSYRGKQKNFIVDGITYKSSNAADGKNVIKLNNTIYSLNNTKHAMFGFFKNLQKLRKDHFFGAKFNHFFHRNFDPYFGTHMAKPEDYQIKSCGYGQYNPKERENLVDTNGMIDNVWSENFMCWLDPLDPKDKLLIDNPNGGNLLTEQAKKQRAEYIKAKNWVAPGEVENRI